MSKSNDFSLDAIFYQLFNTSCESDKTVTLDEILKMVSEN